MSNNGNFVTWVFSISLVEDLKYRILSPVFLPAQNNDIAITY